MNIRFVPGSLEYEAEDRSVGIFGSCFSFTGSVNGGEYQTLVVYDNGEVSNDEGVNLCRDMIFWIQAQILYGAQKNKLTILEAANRHIASQAYSYRIDIESYTEDDYVKYIGFVFKALHGLSYLNLTLTYNQ